MARRRVVPAMPRTVTSPTVEAIREAVVALDAADIYDQASEAAFGDLCDLVGTVAAYRARMRLRHGGVEVAVATAVRHSGLFA